MLAFFRHLLQRICALPAKIYKYHTQQKTDTESLQALKKLESDATGFQLISPIRQNVQFQQDVLRINTEIRYEINALQQQIPYCSKNVQIELAEGIKSVHATLKCALDKHMSKK